MKYVTSYIPWYNIYEVHGFMAIITMIPNFGQTEKCDDLHFIKTMVYRSLIVIIILLFYTYMSYRHKILNRNKKKTLPIIIRIFIPEILKIIVWDEIKII